MPESLTLHTQEPDASCLGASRFTPRSLTLHVWVPHASGGCVCNADKVPRPIGRDTSVLAGAPHGHELLLQYSHMRKARAHGGLLRHGKGSQLEAAPTPRMVAPLCDPLWQASGRAPPLKSPTCGRVAIGPVLAPTLRVPRPVLGNA